MIEKTVSIRSVSSGVDSRVKLLLCDATTLEFGWGRTTHVLPSPRITYSEIRARPLTFSSGYAQPTSRQATLSHTALLARGTVCDALGNCLADRLRMIFLKI